MIKDGKLVDTGVQISSKYTPGWKGMIDRDAGVYWETNHAPGDDELRVQRALRPPSWGSFKIVVV